MSALPDLTVHNVGPLPYLEMAEIPCGHCRHRLSWHVTQESGATYCSACHCLRHPGEDIREPHNFAPAKPIIPPGPVEGGEDRG